MSPALAAGLQIALVVAALALVHVPLGDYMARLLTSPKNNKVETGLYRTLRIEPSADTVHAYWKHTLNLPPDVSRERLQKETAQRYKVPIAWSYWPPIHLQPVFRRLYGTTDGQLPQAEDVTERLVNFPMHVRLSDEDVDYILEAFLACYKALRGSRRPAEEDWSWYLKRV